MLNGWNGFLNNIHVNSQATGNQVANLGLKVLSETTNFDGRNSFPEEINEEFRIMLLQTQIYRNQFDGFLADVSRTKGDVIRILQDCDRVVEENLQTELANDLRRAANCAAL